MCQTFQKLHKIFVDKPHIYELYLNKNKSMRNVVLNSIVMFDQDMILYPSTAIPKSQEIYKYQKVWHHYKWLKLCRLPVPKYYQLNYFIKTES